MKRSPMLVIIIFVFLLLVFFGISKYGFLKKTVPLQKKAQTTPVVKGTVIAKVNNNPITLEELKRYVDIYNASLDLRQDLSAEQRKLAKIDNREKMINYLKTSLIRQAVFYQTALDRGLDRKEDVVEILNRYKVAVLAQEMQNEVIKNIDVSSAEVEEAYKNNKNLFREPEVRRVREIVVKTEEEAKQILIELLQGADFSTIARTRSIAGTGKDGGDLGEIRRGERGEQYVGFDDVAFSLALGQGVISSVFKGPEGYYIIKIEAIREGKQVSLSEAFDTIKAILLDRKQVEELDKAYSRLSQEAKIEVYEGEIK